MQQWGETVRKNPEFLVRSAVRTERGTTWQPPAPRDYLRFRVTVCPFSRTAQCLGGAGRRGPAAGVLTKGRLKREPRRTLGVLSK